MCSFIALIMWIIRILQHRLACFTFKNGGIVNDYETNGHQMYIDLTLIHISVILEDAISLCESNL